MNRLIIPKKISIVVGSHTICITFANTKMGFEDYLSRSTLSALTNGKFPNDMFPENVKSTFGLGATMDLWTRMTYPSLICYIAKDKSHFFTGKLRISMAIFHSYMKLPEGIRSLELRKSRPKDCIF